MWSGCGAHQILSRNALRLALIPHPVNEEKMELWTPGMSGRSFLGIVLKTTGVQGGL